MTETKEIGKVIEERHWTEDKSSCVVTRKAVMDDGKEYKIDVMMFGEVTPIEVAQADGMSNTIKRQQKQTEENILKNVVKHITFDVSRKDKWLGVKATLIVAEEECKK